MLCEAQFIYTFISQSTLATLPGIHCPVGRGENVALCLGADNCCDTKVCELNEGDCDDDDQCSGSLKCGTDNCVGDTFDATDDCCYDPKRGQTGLELNEGDCDDDDQCKGNLVCGRDNCVGEDLTGQMTAALFLQQQQQPQQQPQQQQPPPPPAQQQQQILI